MTAPRAPKRLPRVAAYGTLRPAIPARDAAAGTIRGALRATTRDSMPGIIDTPLSGLARMTGELCLRALSPSAAGPERRPEGGGR